MENQEFVTGTVKLSLFGEPVEMEMTVPARPVKPSRMLPIFQAMANDFVEIGVNAAVARGDEISCKKGCGACCNQPVPISPIEAFRLRELLESFPEPRRSEIKDKFAAGHARFAATDWFKRIRDTVKYDWEERIELVMEYFHTGIPCPFLDDGACSIHPERPLICREFLVTSPAEHCANPTPKSVKGVNLPVKVSSAVRSLESMENKPDFITLIELIEWTDGNPEALNEKTGVEWMQEFFEHLMKKKAPPPN